MVVRISGHLLLFMPNLHCCLWVPGIDTLHFSCAVMPIFYCGGWSSFVGGWCSLLGVLKPQVTQSH